MEKKKILKQGMKKDKLILCFLAGILLLVAAIPTKKGTASAVQTESVSTGISDRAE